MSRESFRFVVSHDGRRLDRLVADATGKGRRQARRWLLAGRVRVDGQLCAAAHLAASGSEIVIEGDDREGAAGEGLLRVLAADSRFLVLAKAAGVHCERGESSPCVADLLEHLYGDLSGVGDRDSEAGLVHRLDCDTSGVLLAARDRPGYEELRREFSRGKALKQYLALVCGVLCAPVQVSVALARRRDRMVEAGPRDEPQPASTRLEPLDAGDDWTLVLATMRTGVTHQVRVHAALAGHPLIGDELYGGPVLEGCRRRGQLLHAFRVRVGGFDVCAAAPADFVGAYAELKRLDAGTFSATTASS